MGMGGGGGATGSGRNGTVYTPMVQPQADTAFQQLVQGMFNPALSGLPGQNPASAAFPAVQDATNSILNNPFAAGAIGGAQQSAGILGGPAATTDLTNAGAASGIGGYGIGLLNPVAGASILNPAYDTAAAMGYSMAPQMGGAANEILSAGLDPQQGLYNRTQSQLTDQTNAQLAGSGLAGTPYGGSVMGNTLGNFGLNWQNAQLGREATAIPVAAQANQAALSSLLTPANNRAAAALEGTSGISNLAGVAGNAFNNADRLYGQAATAAQQSGAVPYQTANTIGANNVSALGNQISLGNQQFALPQQVVNDIESYLGLGQSASNIGNSIGATNFNQLSQGIGGASNLLFGNSLGNGGGLLGAIGANPFSGGGGAAASIGGDFGGGGAALGVPDVFGGGDALASAAPLAFSG